MRITGTSSARAQFYDRNLTTQTEDVIIAAVAPNAGTVEWTYTCPAGRKCTVNSALASIIRDGTATTAGIARATVGATAPSGFASIADARHINVTIGVGPIVAVGQADTYPATTVITGITSDASTGGTNMIRLSAVIGEFDA